MNDIIWYFTGTGNSLAAARRAASALGGDVELKPIASVPAGAVEIAAARLGFVFPVYSFGLPRVVKEFIERIVSIKADSVFAIATCGGASGGTLAQLRKLLEAKGTRLDAAAAVVYPGNCIPLHAAPTEEQCRKMISAGDETVDRFMTDVTAGRQRPPGFFAGINEILFRPMYAAFLSSVRRSDRFLKADETCTRCGVCMKICPVGNIAAGPDGRPVWGGRCEACYACLNFCPAEAIQYGWLTRGRRRYRHPAVTPSDIASQSGKKA